MKTLVTIIAMLLLCPCLQAQSATAKIIDGSKALVDLVAIFKSKKIANAPAAVKPIPVDSCLQKGLANLSFKNLSAKNITISVYKRNGETYAATPFTLKLAAKATEYLYELKAGIYKYKVELNTDDVVSVVQEGELKLQPCDDVI